MSSAVLPAGVWWGKPIISWGLFHLVQVYVPEGSDNNQGINSRQANLGWIYSEQKRQQNSPIFRRSQSSVFAQGSWLCIYRNRLSCYMLTPRAECHPSGRWPGHHSSWEALPIFHTDSLSWNCSYISNISPEQAHCNVYEPVPFGSTFVDQPSMQCNAHITPYNYLCKHKQHLSCTADIPSRLLINFFTEQ